MSSNKITTTKDNRGKTPGGTNMATGRAKPITFNGKEYESRSELARTLGIDPNKLNNKLRSNITVEEAVADLLQEKEMVSIGEKPMNEIIDILKGKENVVISEKEVIMTKPEKKVEPKEERFIFKPIPKKLPKYIQVRSVNELIEILNDIDIDKVNLIDYENIEKDRRLEKFASNEDEVNIFFYNAEVHSNNFFAFAKSINTNIIQVLTYDSANDLVDRMIIFYLSGLLLAYPDKEYSIISKDLSFYRFIENLGYDNIKCIGINYITDGDTRYKYCLCKYIADTRENHRNMIATHEVDKFFKDFAGHKLNQHDVDNLLKAFDKYELVEHVKKGAFDWIKFDMPKIHKFVEEYRP